MSRRGRYEEETAGFEAAMGRYPPSENGHFTPGYPLCFAAAGQGYSTSLDGAGWQAGGGGVRQERGRGASAFSANVTVLGRLCALIVLQCVVGLNLLFKNV